MIYHIRSKYTAVGKCYAQCRQILFPNGQLPIRSQRDCHVLLSLCDHRTARVFPRLEHYSDGEHELPGEQLEYLAFSYLVIDCFVVL